MATMIQTCPELRYIQLDDLMNAQLYLNGVVKEKAAIADQACKAYFKKHELACRAKSDEKSKKIYRQELARLAAEAKLLGIIPAGKTCAANMKRWAGDLEQHAFYLDGVIKGLSHAELGQYLERHVGYAEIPCDSDAGVLALAGLRSMGKYCNSLGTSHLGCNVGKAHTGCP